MNILVLGAAGMIGRKLVERLARDGSALDGDIDHAGLVDIIEPPVPHGLAGRAAARALDLTAPGATRDVIAGRPDVIFHLAAVVSGEAEADFDKGYRVNLDGTRSLFEAIRDESRRTPYRPRVVFTAETSFDEIIRVHIEDEHGGER